MKQLIILFTFLSWFSSLFAQQHDTTITVKGYKLNGQSYTTRDTVVRGYKIKTLNYKRDSLSFSNSRFQKAFNDSTRTFNVYSSFDYKNYDTLSKEITTEVACNPDATIFIENVYRKLIIKTSTDNKVKITTTVSYSVDPKITDAEWFQKINLELKSNNNQVVLKSNFLNNSASGVKTLTITGQSSLNSTMNYQHYNFNNVSNPNAFATFDGDGNWINKTSNTQKILTVYIPAGAKVDVESKYADVEIQNDLKNLKADVTNASLRFMNVENADIQSKYGRINAGNIKKADIELTNGKFIAKNIYSGKFQSKYSDIEFGISNDLKLESTNDQYEIDEVTDLTAHKNYGNIRITNLKNSFNLTGNNADVKIRDISASINNIKIDDKYADIRLPLNNVANYAVDFDGKNCNVYAPFDKIPVIKIEEKKKEPETIALQPIEPKQPTQAKGTLTPLTTTGFKKLNSDRIVFGYRTDAKDEAFKASVGDTKGKHAELQLKCTNCTVDFK